MKITILFIFITLITFSCTEKVKVGDECKLLKPQSEGVTKVENKNLDCLDLDSDGICMSYEGKNSYCTVKCGPSRGCAAVQCAFDYEDKNGEIVEGETCVDSICYPKAMICSETNVNGLCSTGTKCDGGICISICDATEVFIHGVCHPTSELCSVVKKDGLCAIGSTCKDGSCTPTGCEAYPGYECVAPINLKGHPFKNQNICIKQDDLSEACKDQRCSGHGKCKLLGGGAECICDTGFKSAEELTCIAEDDPCKDISCSGNGTCQKMGGDAECKCNTGFVPTADKKDCIAQ